MECIDAIEIITASINCHLSPFNSIQFPVNPNFVWLWDQIGWALPKRAFYFSFIHRFIHTDKNNDPKIMPYEMWSTETSDSMIDHRMSWINSTYSCVESSVFAYMQDLQFPVDTFDSVLVRIKYGKWFKLAVHHDLIEIRSYRHLIVRDDLRSFNQCHRFHAHKLGQGLPWIVRLCPGVRVNSKWMKNKRKTIKVENDFNLNNFRSMA